VPFPHSLAPKATFDDAALIGSTWPHSRVWDAIGSGSVKASLLRWQTGSCQN